MNKKIILASKSGVRKKILNQNNIICEVIPANVDEDSIKESMIKEKATPKIISKNLAEVKANKVSQKKPEEIVLGGYKNFAEGDMEALAKIYHPECKITINGSHSLSGTYIEFQSFLENVLTKLDKVLSTFCFQSGCSCFHLCKSLI